MGGEDGCGRGRGQYASYMAFGPFKLKCFVFVGCKKKVSRRRVGRFS